MPQVAYAAIMKGLEFDRFTDNTSKKTHGNRPPKKHTRTWSYVLLSSVAFLIFTGIILILRSDSHESSFDELVTTGGSVRRRSASENDDESDIKLVKCKTKECKKIEKYIKDSLNMSVDPCQNFYEFACGGWRKKNKIPKTSSTFSTFTKLNQNVEKILKKLLENEAKEKLPPLLKMTTDYYKSCKDLSKINKAGKAPLLDLIKQVKGWAMAADATWNEDNWDIVDVLKDIHSTFTSSGGPLFSVHVTDDPNHSFKHIIEVSKVNIIETGFIHHL